MNLRGIVAVSGKPGLFKLVGQNKAGYVLESLDAQKIKTVVSLSANKMASLEDITIFGDEDDIRLPDVFEQMKSEENLPDVKTATGSDLRDFFRVVAPHHDETRVYSSDIKKIVSWFKILKELPLFHEEAPEPLDAGREKAASEE
ncbi:DUF5606 family protein [Albibacterium bauzanense]|uniref:Uncharacterized protein n=1 Tax=Albibacterium bauzanense TaxID=653929 RepID=A0A4R1LY23_9SPHI|nr:DUF5606 domain-containing protein [Albibacterium bauzanense]TCK83480.1 hypothetical protein C8N28_2081 [Albibacterium bauzanense]